MKMTKLKKYKWLLIAWVFVFLTLTITASYGWLFLENSKDIHFSPGGFSINLEAKYENKSINHDHGIYMFNGLSVDDYTVAKDLIKNQTQGVVGMLDQHVDGMNINVSVSCESSGHIRIKVLDEWLVTRKYINFNSSTTEVVFKDDVNYFPYKLADGWFYDVETKYCYYENVLNRGDHNNIPFITSCENYAPKTSTLFVETCQVNIAVVTQVVQANRYQEVWGITHIPVKEVSPNA